MRKADISKRQVICPNASLIGHSTNKARVGSWIHYGDAAGSHVGRMIGRIEWAEPVGGDSTNVKGWIVALVLTMENRSCSVRWINPKDVLHVYSDTPKAFLEWFVSDWPNDSEALLAVCEFGTMQDQFAHKINKTLDFYCANRRCPRFDEMEEN